ncbi:MAG: PrsW family intramembrane metalloprotease [Candidatus Bilamarchaeaceae archaeon]
MNAKNSLADYIVAAFFLILCLGGVLVSLFVILGISLEIWRPESTAFQDMTESIKISFINGSYSNVLPTDSPVLVPIRVETNDVAPGSRLILQASEHDRIIAITDCFEEVYWDKSIRPTVFECNASIPYNYASESRVQLRAFLELPDGDTMTSNSLQLTYNWKDYEKKFWKFNLVLFVGALLGFLFLILPLAFAMYSLATKEKHHAIYKGEYTISGLLNPFKDVKKPSVFLQAIIASPIFWLAELSGIFIFALSMAVITDSFKSTEALVAFLVSGLVAFFTPFLWVAAWWFADYKKREPLRIIVSLFLWGAFASLMAFGLNSVFNSFFVAVGVGMITSVFFIPIFEEFFKGAGLVLFSFHHEYDSVADGLVFGFVVGMGFTFVENWVYLIQNPMGADMMVWLFLFILRSIIFSAVHGVYTSITGAIIGFMKVRAYPYAILSVVAMLPAMVFHAFHNSGELLIALFGESGAALYCCIIAPLFDYGGLLLIALVMLGWLTLHSRKRQRFATRRSTNSNESGG